MGAKVHPQFQRLADVCAEAGDHVHDRRADEHAYGDEHAHGNPDADPHADGDEHSDGYGNCHTDQRADAHGDEYGDCHLDPHAHIYPNPNADQHGDRYIHSHACGANGPPAADRVSAFHCHTSADGVFSGRPLPPLSPADIETLPTGSTERLDGHALGQP